MKSKPSDKARLLHITDAVAEIESYVKDIDFADFEQDSKTRFASIKQLEIIGEASYHLSSELINKYSEVSWAPIIALEHV